MALLVSYGVAADSSVQVERFERTEGDLTALKRDARNPLRLQETEIFIVQLKGEPLATYAGAREQIGTLGAERSRPQLNLQSIQAREHESFLHAQQRSFVSDLQRRIPRATMYRQFATAMNAVAIEVPKGTSMQALSAHPDVARVYRNELRYEQMDASLDLINVADSWESAGGRADAGAGVRIAIVDGGIRPENPMFTGAGLTPATDRPADDYCATVDASFCTNKIIAARYSEPTITINENEYMSPLDYGGHGTHVAGTAAGDIVDANVSGTDVELSGVAPGAYLMVYKALFRTPAGPGSGSDVMLVEALEHAIEDGADVINNSWGGGPGANGTDSIYDVIFGNAEDAGIVVVTAAGNDGPGEQTIGCPGCVEPGLTVAASATGRSFESRLSYDELSLEIYPGSGNFSISEDITAPLVLAENVSETDSLACEAFPADSLEGTIVLVDRGTCSFEEKAGFAQAAGAVAMVVANNEEGVIRMTMGAATLPSVSVTQEDGISLRNAYVEDSELTIGALTSVVELDDVNRLADFSSRGQNGDNRYLKPDITAPGVDILSADSPDLVDAFGTKSGTSMASPHVAGAAALLRQLRPELDARQVKALLMGTADGESVTNHNNDDLADAFGQGAGLLNVGAAESADFVLDSASLVATTCQSSCALERAVTNLSDEAIEVAVTTENFSNPYVTATVSSEGVETGDTASISVPAGESVTFSVTIDSRFADDGWNFGSLAVTSSASTQSFPIVFSSERADDATVLNTEVVSGEPTWGELASVESRFESPAKGEEVSVTVNFPEGFEVDNVAVSESNASGTLEVGDTSATWTGTFADPSESSSITPIAAPAGSVLDVASGDLFVTPAGVGCAEETCDEFALLLEGLEGVGGLTYNGTTYDSITVYDNGLIAIGDQSSVTSTYFNLDFPDAEVPNNIIAPLWSDFTMGGELGGEVYYAGVELNGVDYLVIEWHDAKVWTETVSATDPSYTFSVWLGLGESDDIIFNYVEVPAMPEFASIGLEDLSGTVGLSYFFDGAGETVSSDSALDVMLDIEPSEVLLSYDLPLAHSQNLTADTEWNTEVAIDVLGSATIVSERSLATAIADVQGTEFNSRAPLIVEPTGAVNVVIRGVVEGGEVSTDGESITFTPDPTFKGEQVITYVLADEAGNESAEYTLTVNVAPRDAKKWYEGNGGLFFLLLLSAAAWRRAKRS